MFGVPLEYLIPAVLLLFGGVAGAVWKLLSSGFEVQVKKALLSDIKADVTSIKDNVDSITGIVKTTQSDVEYLKHNGLDVRARLLQDGRELASVRDDIREVRVEIRTGSAPK